jgi:hypothetical protein
VVGPQSSGASVLPSCDITVHRPVAHIGVQRTLILVSGSVHACVCIWVSAKRRVWKRIKI